MQCCVLTGAAHRGCDMGTQRRRVPRDTCQELSAVHGKHCPGQRGTCDQVGCTRTLAEIPPGAPVLGAGEAVAARGDHGPCSTSSSLCSGSQEPTNPHESCWIFNYPRVCIQDNNSLWCAHSEMGRGGKVAHLLLIYLCFKTESDPCPGQSCMGIHYL